MFCSQRESFSPGYSHSTLFQIVCKNSLNIPLVQKPMHFYVENPSSLLPAMVTLEMAGGPFQSLWSPPSPHKPAMLCQQLISSICQAAPPKQHHSKEQKGPGTEIPVTCYVANANPVGITIALTMDCTVPPVYLCTHQALTPALDTCKMVHHANEFDLPSPRHDRFHTRHLALSTPTSPTRPTAVVTTTSSTTIPQHYTKTEKDTVSFTSPICMAPLFTIPEMQLELSPNLPPSHQQH